MREVNGIDPGTPQRSDFRHIEAFFFDIRQYAFRKETLRCNKTATFSVLRSFEKADFYQDKEEK